jgi:hypothetical protein
MTSRSSSVRLKRAEDNTTLKDEMEELKNDNTTLKDLRMFLLRRSTYSRHRKRLC